MPTDQVTEAFVQEWFDLLSAHAPIDQLLPFLATDGLVMQFPERTLYNHADVRDWYAAVGESYTSQDHIVENVDATPSAAGTDLAVTVVWLAQQISDDAQLAFRVNQSWRLTESPATGRPLIVEYHVLTLRDL